MTMIYLDNAASTRTSEEVIARMTEVMRTAWGNPSSAHPQGAAARRWIDGARGELLAAINDVGGARGDVVWTSGCTEADALAVLGAARARGRGRVIISALEHAAVSATAAMLRDDGHDVIAIGADAHGALDLDALDRALDGDVAVVALVLVQNELGVIQPIAEAARRVRARAPDAHVHCDAAQALGKIPVDAAALGVDSIAIAGHKLHGPKGVGALWLARGARLRPLWGGGGQQGNLRSGTQDAPGAAGLGLAATRAVAALDASAARWRGFARVLHDAARASGVPTRTLTDEAATSPHIALLAFDGVPAGALRAVLASRGVMVSTGSACADRDTKPSAALAALGVGPTWGVARCSFGHDTTAAEIAAAGAIIAEVARELAQR